MEELIAKVPAWIQAISFCLSGLVVVATAVAHLTPTKKDDEKVGKFKALVDRFIQWLPTVGINPKTRELEKKVKESEEISEPVAEA